MVRTPDVEIDPLVSIVITNYNYGCFLPNAIESALRQHYPSVEVIVVDDGSTDQSREVMQAYDKRILSLFKANGGQASAMNLGFQQSHGDLVIFLDADDMLLPNIVQHVVEAFRVQPDVTKVMYRMEVIDAKGHLTGEIKPDPHLPLRSGDLRPYILNFPFDLTWMATSGNAFHTKALQQILPIPEQDFPIMADFYLSHLVPLFGTVAFLPEIGAHYRLHSSNNYARTNRELNVAQMREFISYAQKTCGYIEHFANAMEPSIAKKKVKNLSSVSILSKRLTSLKLDPQGHPIQDDTVWGLFRAGVAASWRRFDVSWPMRMLYILWFIAMLPAPMPVAHWLASIFSNPEKRGSFNRFLGALHVVKQKQ